MRSQKIFEMPTGHCFKTFCVISAGLLASGCSGKTPEFAKWSLLGDNKEAVQSEAPRVNHVQNYTPVTEKIPDYGYSTQSLPAPKAPPRPGTVIVQHGDTLYAISRRTGVPVRNLIALNRLNNDRIYAGQTLVVR